MRRVLLLHTGGTLGMRGAPLEPDRFASELTDSVPEINQLAELESQIVCNVDSSDVGPEVWSALAELIHRERTRFDGFVIVHGTDTMAYTASALAFALRGLDRPVVLTGAQRPLASVRTDARRNLGDAVELATLDIPEVGICFDGLLLRGCCTTKSNVHDYRAFTSPSCAPLARLGVSIDVAAHIRRPQSPFQCDPRFDGRVMVLQVSPGLDPTLFEALLGQRDRLRGVVLVAFGSGTVPRLRRPLAPIVRDVIAAGLEVMVVTRSSGRVDLGLYQNSRPLLEAGAISGGAMSVEAAVTKLMHALALHDDRDARRRFLEWNIAGELS